MNKYSIVGAAALACGLGLATPASATLTLQSGLVGGSGDVDNVIFNACGTAQSGNPLQGCLNTSHSTLVNFSSNETLVVGGGGQDSVRAQDGTFNTVTIALDDTTQGFGKLQFNLIAEADGTANFTATDQFGNVFAFNNVALDGNGQNFFTLGS
ncbi:hypothetical protein, partial [Sabulicella rubraurantiaca]|uniref:hypothetical protein n=1 Tax=Sabulicella rubraurantiaca TaxID=2811429 RepID=UPI001A966D93